jgi:DNA-binding transcriptional LysR family regulator
MDLRQIDLNLLLIFNQLLLDRRVSTAAEKLGLTQPAVSNALKRLRTLLSDELFVRTARGMEPTPYAMHLAEPVGQALSALQNAFSQRDTFDPTTSSRTFTLAMTDIGEIYFMPPLLEALARLAPHIKISTLRNTAGNLREDMESGSVDLDRFFPAQAFLSTLRLPLSPRAPHGEQPHFLGELQFLRTCRRHR